MRSFFCGSLLSLGFIAKTYGNCVSAERYRVRGLEAYGAQGTPMLSLAPLRCEGCFTIYW